MAFYQWSSFVCLHSLFYIWLLASFKNRIYWGNVSNVIDISVLQKQIKYCFWAESFSFFPAGRFKILLVISNFWPLFWPMYYFIQCISKDNTASCFLTFFAFIISPVVSELLLHVVCLCFRFRDLTKQIPTLHNVINLIIVLSISYFIHQLLLLLQQGDIESNPGQRTSKLIAYLVVTEISIVYWLKICLRFLKLKRTVHSIVIILPAYQKPTLI